MSVLPSSEKTPVPLMCQLGPGFATRPPPRMVVPLMSHSATDPSLFCRTMPVLPSAKKPGAADAQGVVADNRR